MRPRVAALAEIIVLGVSAAFQGSERSLGLQRGESRRERRPGFRYPITFLHHSLPDFENGLREREVIVATFPRRYLAT